MSTQAEKAVAFARLHVKGDPLILFNIWDPGSARALQEVGAKAIATGSVSVAAAHGFEDGEDLPLELVIANVKRIVDYTALPVTLDFEGGYGRTSEALAQNTSVVIDSGAVGINFEDQVIGGEGLYAVEEQVTRIAAIRRAAEQKSLPLFINARTDIFLKAPPATHSEDHLQQAIRRAEAFTQAGASGFFAPGLRDMRMIEQLCSACSLPVNILLYPDMPSTQQLAQAGVARISHGPFPYRQMIRWLKAAAQDALS